MPTEDIALVSAHGAHSIEFCDHAEGEPLEQMVKTYIERGFTWFGITEHMPPPSDEFTLDEERALGLDVAAQHERFKRYMTTCRHLQSQYADAVDIYVGFECEAYTGALASARVSVRYSATGAGQPAQAALYRSGLRALPEARAEWPLDRRRMDQADCEGLMLRRRSRTHALWRCIAKDIATTHGSRVCRSRVREPHGSWGVGRVFAGHTA